MAEIPAFPRAPGDDGVRVFAFTVGWMEMPLGYFLKGEDGMIRFPATAYLIDHPKGLALFDTGLGERFLRPVGTPFAGGPVDLTEPDTIPARLREIGVEPGAIQLILCSHLHGDHAGGNRWLPNATVVLQRAEYDHAFGEEDRAYHRPEFDTGQPFRKIEGEYDVFGDGTVVLFPTPGHTAGHQSLRVKTAWRELVLTSDCCNLKRSLDDLHLPEGCHDADQYLGTLKNLARMRERGTLLFYGHDPEFWKQVPQAVPLRWGPSGQVA